MKQPKKEDVGGGGVVVGGGLASFQWGMLILGKLKSAFHRTYCSHENGSFINFNCTYSSFISCMNIMN